MMFLGLFDISIGFRFENFCWSCHMQFLSHLCLVAPCTDLDYYGCLPGKVLLPRKLSQSPIVSYGQLCRGEREAQVPNPHRLYDVTNQKLYTACLTFMALENFSTKDSNFSCLLYFLVIWATLSVREL